MQALSQQTSTDCMACEVAKRQMHQQTSPSPLQEEQAMSYNKQSAFQQIRMQHLQRMAAVEELDKIEAHRLATKKFVENGRGQEAEEYAQG